MSFLLLACVSATIQVDVIVLNYDPVIEGKPLHEWGKWTDPQELSKGYIADVLKASGGYIRFRIVEWRDLDTFPIKTDGYRYTAASYVDATKARKWHDPDGLDYPKTIAETGVISDIDSGKADEIWLFGAPYMGFWESAMAGPRAFYINGGTYPEVKSKRPFAIMGFNYERGVAEMLHDLSHRTESTMSRVFGGWRTDLLTNDWAHFAANDKQSLGYAAVGTCHWPPNAEKDYDYANPRTVMSTAEDWLAYPRLTGAKKSVSCESWGGPDYHRNYMKWWFMHIPRADGVSGDGRQLNWWKYIFDYDRYNERGRLR